MKTNKVFTPQIENFNIETSLCVNRFHSRCLEYTGGWVVKGLVFWTGTGLGVVSDAVVVELVVDF